MCWSRHGSSSRLEELFSAQHLYFRQDRGKCMQCFRIALRLFLRKHGIVRKPGASEFTSHIASISRSHSYIILCGERMRFMQPHRCSLNRPRGHSAHRPTYTVSHGKLAFISHGERRLSAQTVVFRQMIQIIYLEFAGPVNFRNGRKRAASLQEPHRLGGVVTVDTNQVVLPLRQPQPFSRRVVQVGIGIARHVANALFTLIRDARRYLMSVIGNPESTARTDRRAIYFVRFFSMTTRIPSCLAVIAAANAAAPLPTTTASDSTCSGAMAAVSDAAPFP